MTLINKELKHSDLTGKIIKCCLAVHSNLGNGFQEKIYQRALVIELTEADIAFSREHEMPIYYKQQQIGTRRVDFFVEGKVSLEIKAVIELENGHLAQAMNYLEVYDLEVGLLVNFGATSLQVRRLKNRSFKQGKQGNPHILQRHSYNQHGKTIRTSIRKPTHRPTDDAGLY